MRRDSEPQWLHADHAIEIYKWAVAGLIFLDANGYDWTQPDDGTLAEWVLALIYNEIDKEELAHSMRPHVAARPTPRNNPFAAAVHLG